MGGALGDGKSWDRKRERQRQSMEDINDTLRNHVLYNHYTIYVLKHIVVMFHRPLINAQ